MVPHDPVFGAVLHDRHGWKAVLPSPSGVGTIEVRGGSTQEHLPGEHHRRAYSELLKNYASAVPQLQGALFRLWEPELRAGHWGETAPTTTHALWSMLELEAVTIEPNGSAHLYYAFIDSFWPDASLVVELERGVARPLHLDD
jgi:hypothetical protein